ncbi:MAG: T9SS type A sorting domain-containing protein [Candidatus Kapabacteria bacterium]|nr:T9SS type A sorting domain-containing protein [Candidatus Kapabacteria bacterium]
MIKIFIIFGLFLTLNLRAEYFKSGIDTVYFFNPGSGQNSGQSPDYFPENIFGLPDTNASELTPSSDPKQICSIGLGGEIIVGFKNYIIFDGDGPDFTIFENAFINPVTKKVFAEPSKVSISEDGINFVEFPYDPWTLIGCAGITPTNGKANPYDPEKSGGDKFDLATIGLKKAKYIKITDICDDILNNPKHPFYDPIISGFDLDAVVGLNLISVTSNIANENDIELFPKLIKMADRYEIHTNSLINDYIIYDYLGKVVSSGRFNDNLIIENKNFDNSLYFLVLNSNFHTYHFKISF